MCQFFPIFLLQELFSVVARPSPQTEMKLHVLTKRIFIPIAIEAHFVLSPKYVLNLSTLS